MLIIFPQSEIGSWQTDTADGQLIMAILADVMREYAVDRKCLNLTATSVDGIGGWSSATRYPHTWAAIVRIYSGGDRASPAAIKHISCWCLFWTYDTVIDLGHSRRMIEALWAAGASPRCTKCANIGQPCWGRTCGTPERWKWLRRQRLGDRSHDESTSP